MQSDMQAGSCPANRCKRAAPGAGAAKHSNCHVLLAGRQAGGRAHLHERHVGGAGHPACIAHDLQLQVCLEHTALRQYLQYHRAAAAAAATARMWLFGGIMRHRAKAASWLAS